MKISAVVLTVLALLVSTVAAAMTPEESLKKNFPDIPFQSISPSEIKGLYEVVVPGRILYYSPDSEKIIVGDIVSKEMKNLTREKMSLLIAARLRQLPLDKALKIGEGKTIVVEITNPDCQYCRKSSDFLSRKKDLTRYIFFMPFSPESEAKIEYILCAKDKAAAYDKAMTGGLDDMKFKACGAKEVKQKIRSDQEILARAGVRSTPYFLINGQAVMGADMEMLERLLGPDNPPPATYFP
ncbi:MAG: DsbC family protein [Syntrophales bacterium]|nr:DsbC family protein [Syntrophales bacterium]MDD5532937.1 DsbC family protein [Syntrophales bacterium]